MSQAASLSTGVRELKGQLHEFFATTKQVHKPRKEIHEPDTRQPHSFPGHLGLTFVDTNSGSSSQMNLSQKNQGLTAIFVLSLDL